MGRRYPNAYQYRCLMSGPKGYAVGQFSGFRVVNQPNPTPASFWNLNLNSNKYELHICFVFVMVWFDCTNSKKNIAGK